MNRDAQSVWCDLDAASARPLHPAAREALLAAYEAGYADPRRLHHAGRRARAVLDNAREVVAEALGARADEITFTGSGTEAVHRGLLGVARGRRRVARRIAHSAVEHACVLQAAEHARATDGAELCALKVDPTGRVDLEAIAEVLREPLGLLAVQSANHEVGTLQPLGQIAGAAAEAGVPLLVDACASLGWVDLPAGWSVAAGSAHKWGGPGGIGVLAIRKGTRWREVGVPDDRSDARAIGFEAVPLALAAAAALQAVRDEAAATDRHLRPLVERIRTEVPRRVSEVEVVGDPERRLPHLVTFSCLYVEGEALVTALDRRGFGIGSGSACTTSTGAPSPVLAAMGALTQGNVRVSLHPDTRAEDVERFLDVLPETIAELRAEIGA